MSFWNRIFTNKPHTPNASAATPDIVVPPPEGEPREGPPVTCERAVFPGLEWHLDISVQTDPGNVRQNNEDRGFFTRPKDAEAKEAKGTLILVADGMGGASAGEFASDMAVRYVPETYYKSPEPPAAALKAALETASAEIYAAAQRDPALRGMGTTCVALAICQAHAFVAYIGDSRVYLLREGQLFRLTEDHSVVFELVRQGVLTREQARNHEERNVLSLSMGGRPEVTAACSRPMPVRVGDRFLLSSDGVHDLLDDDRIQAIIAEVSPDEAVRGLILAAKQRGGHDNITAAIVHVATDPASSETDSRETREFTIASE